MFRPGKDLKRAQWNGYRVPQKNPRDTIRAPQLWGRRLGDTVKGHDRVPHRVPHHVPYVSPKTCPWGDRIVPKVGGHGRGTRLCPPSCPPSCQKRPQPQGTRLGDTIRDTIGGHNHFVSPILWGTRLIGVNLAFLSHGLSQFESHSSPFLLSAAQFTLNYS